MREVRSSQTTIVVEQDGDGVVLTDVETGIAGAGATLDDARVDLVAMEVEHLEMLESHADDELTERLREVRRVLRARHGRSAHG